MTRRAWLLTLSVALLLLATALRLPTLADQSFWNDEGNTARLVERPISLILEGAAGDIHPPGYYLLLHVWRALVGETEFALRAYSAYSGILTVAVTIAIARRASRGTLAAVAAGLIAVLHPLSVVYSGEARMYAQLGLIAALTLWAAIGLVTQRRKTQDPRHSPTTWPRALLLALAIAAGLYTQYTYALALVALDLAFALWWLTRRPRTWRLLAQWIAAHAVGGLLFAPWAPIALRASGWRPPDLAQGEAARALFRTLLVGTTYPDAPLALLLPVAAGLLLLAVAHSLTSAQAGSPRRFAAWAALAMAIIPAGIILVAGLYRPAYRKFLMMSIAPIAVSLAIPLALPSWDHRPWDRQAPAWLWSVPPALLLLAGLLPWQLKSLHNMRADPAYIRDDYRGIATRIRAESRAGDAILLSAPNQWEVFTYYYGRQPGDDLPVHPAPYRPTEIEAEAWVRDIVGRRTGGKLVALYWGDTESDPQRHIERALATQAFKAGERWITTVRVATYGIGPAGPGTTRSQDVTLGDDIRLTGASLPNTAWHPGDIIPLTLLWEPITTPTERLKVFVHLVDDAGALVAQNDSEPLAGFAPTTTWKPGEPIVDHYGVALPTDLVPGDHTLLLGMYTLAGDRLPITQKGAAIGDALPLHTLTVLPPP